MQIIDTFLFSEPHESDLLYIKLMNESPRVDWWIIQENSYTTKGEYKGLFAQEVLKEDRFEPFRNKIIVCSAQERLAESSEESTNFKREGWQRTLCWNVLPQIVKSDDDLIIVSDVDESIDFSCNYRNTRFNDFAQKQERGRPYWIGRRRYWYDFDNACFLKNIRIPVLPVLCLNGPDTLPMSRHYHDENRTLNNFDNPIAFEYSYCFKQWTDVQRKHITYAHTGLSDEEDVKRGLLLNAWIRSKNRGEKRSEYDFFEKIELTEENSPKYVRENLENLRTNIVNPDYKKAREEYTEIYI